MFAYEVVEFEMQRLTAVRTKATAWLEEARARGDASDVACIAAIAILD